MDHSEPGMGVPAASRGRTRCAYERGRVLAGLRLAAWVLPMVAFAVLLQGDPAARLSVGGALFATAATFGWRGGAWGRAVIPGLLAGAVPMGLPMLARASDAGCALAGMSCTTWCLAACLAGGTIAGALLGYRAARTSEARLAAFCASGVVAVMTGSLGCLVIGSAGLLGLVAGFGITAVPVLAVATRRP